MVKSNDFFVKINAVLLRLTEPILSRRAGFREAENENAKRAGEQPLRGSCEPCPLRLNKKWKTSFPIRSISGQAVVI